MDITENTLPNYRFMDAWASSFGFDKETFIRANRVAAGGSRLGAVSSLLLAFDTDGQR